MTITEDEDNASVVPRRINRNTRIREAWYEASVVIDRANNKLGATMREQYPEGTTVCWKTSNDKGVRYGLALSQDHLHGPYVRVRDNKTSEVVILTVEELLAGGDKEFEQE